jgi:hypothetical protein
MLCLIITNASATAGSRELDEVEVVIETVFVEPLVWRGEPGWLSVIVSNTGTVMACEVYEPPECSPFTLDVYVNPTAPPDPEEPGSCFGYVPPIPPGHRGTAHISFTLDADRFWLPGNCPATTIREFWLELNGDVYGPFGLEYKFFLPLITNAD